MENNILLSLFSYMPREEMTPEENFLTEAFAHILKIDTNLACEWVKYCADLELEQDSLQIFTQASYSDKGVPIRSDKVNKGSTDMVITGCTKKGQSFTIWHEHKWDDYAIKDNLIKYKEYLKKNEPEHKLIFVGKHVNQIGIARPNCDNALLWADVYQFLSDNDSAADLYANRMREQLLDFMKTKKLAPPEPLSESKLRAYSFGESSGETVPDDCLWIVEQLSTCNWRSVPDYFTKNEKPRVRHRVGQHPYKNQNWGRTGIEFGDWYPGIFMGFLLEPSKHHMDPLPENTGELIFMIEVHDDYKKYFGMIKDCLIKKGLNGYVKNFRDELPETKIYGPRDNPEDPWRQLVIRERLANMIQGKETVQEQVDVIYQRLKDWCQVVFKGDTVEEIFKDYFDNIKSS